MQESLSCALDGLPFAEQAYIGPYRLGHFLPAGTVTQPLPRTGLALPCEHDEWHALRQNPSTTLVGLEESLVRSIDFLTKHDYIAVTARVAVVSGTRVIILRIYLVPHDLSGVEGRLRRRDEVKVAQPARRFMLRLLLRLNRDDLAWDGRPSLTKAFFKPFFGNDSFDTRTIAELYNSLPSPRVDDDAWEHIEADTTRLQEMFDTGNVSGLRSELYRYQRGTIISMLQKEAPSGFVDDPCYVPIHGLDGSTFYFQPESTEILRDRPTVAQARGGILCEELGTGKTVMILGLVLATLDQLPAPEESLIDPRPVLTPLSIRHFPSEPLDEVRQKLSKSLARKKRLPADTSRLPRLAEYCLDQCCLNSDRIDMRDPESEAILTRVRVSEAFQQNIPFYLHYADEPFGLKRPRRNPAKRSPPKMVYLSSATLVVVPPTLHNQWANEMNKHCDSTLRRFTATEGELPSARELVSYDVILLTHTKLSAEASKADQKALHGASICRCSSPSTWPVRVPDCQCKTPAGVSPLLQVRWKRIVIDEGHNMSDKTTKFFGFIEQMSVECRWIVTGTPTTNLMGLQFGKADTELSSDISDGDVDPQDPLGGLRYPDSDDEAVAELMEQEFSSFQSRPSGWDDPELGIVHGWTREDREDLNKLGNMMTHFLKAPEFVADAKAFSSRVVAPLMDRAGPKPGSVRVLQQIMENHMVRHRIEDIEEEIKLPPMVQETVLLDLDSLGVKTYNTLQAVIAINGVDSEFTGSDWFFHAKNVKHLLQVMENVSQSLFYHIDEKHMDVDDALRSGDKFIKKAQQKIDEGKLEPQHLELLYTALEHINNAASDELWRAVQEHPYTFSRVYKLPSEVFESWSLMPKHIGKLSDNLSPEPFVWLIPDRLVQLRRLVLEQPLCPLDRMRGFGELVNEQDKERRRLHKEKPSVRKEEKRSSNPAARVESTAKLFAIQDKLKDLSKADEGDAGLHASSLLKKSLLAEVRLGNSSSSKLNYILNDVMLYSANEKFLIFSRSPMSLMYIAEGLSLLNVPFKMTVLKRIRELRQEVTTFESSDMYRVFLMELKHGARGLNLVTASRVIFCEPVWQADVEAQAIKRVHRIGQTKPVVVKTLAIRGTAEEIMVARRDALKRGQGAAGGKLPSLEEDNVMREFIANPRFLPEPQGEPLVQLDYPLLPQLQSMPDPIDDVVMQIDPSDTATRPQAGPSVRFAAATELPSPSPEQNRTITFADDPPAVSSSRRHKNLSFTEDSPPSPLPSPEKRKRTVSFANEDSPSPKRRNASCVHDLPPPSASPSPEKPPRRVTFAEPKKLPRVRLIVRPPP